MSSDKTNTDKFSGGSVLKNTDYGLFHQWKSYIDTKIGRKPGLTGQMQAAGVMHVELRLQENIEDMAEVKRKQKRQQEIKETIENGTVIDGTPEHAQAVEEWKSLGTPEYIKTRNKELTEEFDKLSKDLDRVTNNVKDIFEIIEKTTDNVLQAIATKAEKDHEKDKAMGLKTALNEIEKRMQGHPTEIQAKIKAKLAKAKTFIDCTGLQNLVNQLDMIKKEMTSQAKESKIQPDIKDSEMITILRDQYKTMTHESKLALPVTVRSTLEVLDPATDKWDEKAEIIRKLLINPINDEMETEEDRTEDKKLKQEAKQEAVAFTATTAGGRDARTRRPPGSDPRSCHYRTQRNCPFGSECEYQHESDNQARGGDRDSSQERGLSRRDRSRSRDNRERERDGRERDRDSDTSKSRDRRYKEREREDRNRGGERGRGRDRDGGDRSRSSSRDTAKHAPQARRKEDRETKYGDKGSSNSRRT
jgi:hypothetical protein